jgi:hypothetical protein
MIDMSVKIPIRYLPRNLTETDQKKQVRSLLKSRKMYKSNKYYTRKNIPSYTSKESQHIKNARKIYNVENVAPNEELAQKTGCTITALNEIVRKGEGAYYSSGSRPNQTPQSWGLARLASSITGGKSAAVDYNILKEGCNHRKKAFILANKSRKKYKYGQSRTKRLTVKI